jgi:hypothetical protein
MRITHVTGDGGTDLTAGDSVLVEPPNSDPDLEDDVVRVVWADDTGRSATVTTLTGPDAERPETLSRRRPPFAP